MHQENFDKWPNFLSNWPAMLPGIYIEERPVLYNRYKLGPGPWVNCPDASHLRAIYDGGFIPLSIPHPNPQRFFQARSLRINLSQWETGKKRRYQHRQWEAHSLQRILFSKEKFLQTFGSTAIAKAQLWMEARFGSPYLEPHRLAFLLHHPLVSSILAWTRHTQLMAFALLIHGDWGAHYWFVFYSFHPESPHGHGYLMDFLQWAKVHTLPFAYLGTTYGNASLYKSRGFQGVEFWNNDHWSNDKNLLAHLQAHDAIS